jgi:hypothetical protein
MVQAKETENCITKEESSKVSKNYKTFGTMSIVFGLFFALCFYKAGTGISVPIFTIGNSIWIWIWIKKLGKKPKKETWFYLGSAILLSSSILLSTNVYMRVFTKIGVMILYFCYMIYQLHDDMNWGFSKYIVAVMNTVEKTISKLHLPIKDLVNCSKGEKHRIIKNVFIGIIISIPLVAIVLLLLSHADVIFANIISIDNFTKTSDTINFILVTILVYFIVYAFMNAVEQKDIEPTKKEGKKSDAIIAITFTSILSMIYFAFSGIQIFALFLGKMKLPVGYTYAEYARAGFFQLLVICMLNMLLVLFCLKKYEDAKGLRITLTCISISTFIIIASSAFRMGMYVKEYNLTFLRILVFWSLLVVLFLMVGVVIRIYMKEIQTFRYSMVVITICYMILAFMKPDFIIAKYNLSSMVNKVETTEVELYNYQDMGYVYSLSTDIMPAIRDFVEDREYLLFNDNDKIDVLLDLNEYLNEVIIEEPKVRNFNIAQYIAEKDARFCKEKIVW